jgi:hypothetical protein
MQQLNDDEQPLDVHLSLDATIRVSKSLRISQNTLALAGFNLVAWLLAELIRYLIHYFN